MPTDIMSTSNGVYVMVIRDPKTLMVRKMKPKTQYFKGKVNPKILTSLFQPAMGYLALHSYRTCFAFLEIVCLCPKAMHVYIYFVSFTISFWC